MPTMTIRKSSRPQREKTRSDKLASPFTIWSRLLGNDKPMSPTVANFFLKVKFPEEDHQRVAVLNQLANDGLLSSEEREELEEYIRVDAIVSIMKSKARQALAKHGR